MKIHKVLVVDDSYVNRNLVKGILKEAKHQLVGEAQDGQEAINMIPVFKPSVITLDLNMPNVTGYEVIEFIKEHYPLLPIIVITGDRHIQNHEKALELGANFVIKKPFQPAFLMKRLDLTPYIESIYLKEEVVEDDNEDEEFLIVNKAVDRPSENIQIFNASTQIVFEEKELNLPKQQALNKQSIVTVLTDDDDDDELFAPIPVSTYINEPISKIVTKQETQQKTPAKIEFTDDEEVLEENEAGFDSRTNSNDWRFKKQKELLVDNEDFTVQKTQDELTQTKKAVQQPISDSTSDGSEDNNIHEIYGKELFVIYEQPSESSENTQSATRQEESVPSNRKVDERLNRPIRPPMINRRPLSAKEKERFIELEDDYVLKNEREKSEDKPKEKGFFSKLFGKK